MLPWIHYLVTKILFQQRSRYFKFLQPGIHLAGATDVIRSMYSTSSGHELRSVIALADGMGAFSSWARRASLRIVLYALGETLGLKVLDAAL